MSCEEKGRHFTNPKLETEDGLNLRVDEKVEGPTTMHWGKVK